MDVDEPSAASPPSPPHRPQEGSGGPTSSSCGLGPLTCEAAHNLSQMLVQSGSPELARKVMRTYLVF
jgi:hypothetical protein